MVGSCLSPLRTPEYRVFPSRALWSPFSLPCLSGVIPSDVLGLRDGAALLLRERVPTLHLEIVRDAASTCGGHRRAWTAPRPAANA